jgi:1-acyl-sn-glycerol-3-phosphate acyltransferase
MATERALESQPPSGVLLRGMGRLWFRVFGWRLEGGMPATTRMVIIAAPHTTNWDLPFMLASAYQLGFRPSWLGKRQLFRAPFGWVMRLLGGVPVDRGQRSNLVQQVVERFENTERLFLVVPPSGTRSKAAHWKSGFYHIARAAGVPILCTSLDYSRRVAAVGLVLVPSGDVAADMDKIRAFYAPIRGKYPEAMTPIRLPEEDAPRAATA